MTTTPTTAPTLASLVDKLAALDGSAVCPGIAAIMTSAEYQLALEEYKSSPLTEKDRPALYRTYREMVLRTDTVDVAPELSEKEWLRRVLPLQVAIFVASIQAEYELLGQAADPHLTFALGDGVRFEVFADDGLALRSALGNHLLRIRSGQRA